MAETLNRFLQCEIGLCEKLCEDLAPFARITKVKKNEVLLPEDKACTRMLLVVSGALKRSYTIREREFTYEFATDNDLVTDYDCFLQERPSESSISAVLKSEVIILTVEFFKHLKQIDPERCERLKQWLMKKREKREKESACFAIGDIEERYATFRSTYPTLVSRLPDVVVSGIIRCNSESLGRVRRDMVKKVPKEKENGNGM